MPCCTYHLSIPVNDDTYAIVAHLQMANGRSGDGGRGELVESGKGRWVDNFKYRPGGSAPKRIWLPASESSNVTAAVAHHRLKPPPLDCLPLTVHCLPLTHSVHDKSCCSRSSHTPRRPHDTTRVQAHLETVQMVQMWCSCVTRATTTCCTCIAASHSTHQRAQTPTLPLVAQGPNATGG
jgi:hypothetical protein